MGEENSVLELSFQMGEILLRNGAEISRVQETMERVAQAYQVEKFNVYVLTNAIFAVGLEQGKERSVELRHIPAPPRTWGASARSTSFPGKSSKGSSLWRKRLRG